MTNEFAKKSLEELEEDIINIENQMIIQRRLLYGDDKYQRARAKRKMMNLCSDLEIAKKEYTKLARQQVRKYKIDKQLQKHTGYTRAQISKKTSDKYGMNPKEFFKNAIKGTVAFVGIAVTLYGTVWAAYLNYLNEKEEKKQSVKTNVVEQQEDKDISNKESIKIDEFLNTSDGRNIERYSSMYGVDKSLAAAIYLNSSNIIVNEEIDVYNIDTNQYDAVIPLNYTRDDQIKAVCAKLAEISQMCKGNPIAIASIYEKGYNDILKVIQDTGVNIDDYKSVSQSEAMNTEFTKQVMQSCPKIINNSWYQDGHLYTRTTDITTGNDYIEDNVVDSVIGYNR